MISLISNAFKTNKLYGKFITLGINKQFKSISAKMYKSLYCLFMEFICIMINVKAQKAVVIPIVEHVYIVKYKLLFCSSLLTTQAEHW